MDALELTEALIARQSVTPEDAGCQQLLSERLAGTGFTAEFLPFGEVTNLWARRGSAAPCIVFAGHTDVVPAGDPAAWDSDPFTPTRTADGCLRGRGAADMKASLAAMVCAAEEFVRAHPAHRGSIAFLITSDEEGPAENGTKRVMETLLGRAERFEYCIVGEPSSDKVLGDTVRNGRRGSLSGLMTIHGALGHVAYPLELENPMHAFARFVDAMSSQPVDDGNAHFPATTFQLVHVHSDAGAPNVVPDELKCRFNLRYNTNWTHQSLRASIEQRLAALKINHTLNWRVAGEPFITEPGTLTDAVIRAITAETGETASLSTSGGTSDGRFIAPHGIDVVEIGPLNRTIHKINEEVLIEDIFRLQGIYRRILENLLC